jgi:organic radical activating enzyme
MTRSKLDNENYQEYTDRVLNSKSSSFCGAKWYNATIWLGSGQTTSCHHPLPHAIDLEAIKINPSAIHNTAQKKMERIMMQTGDRPKGCEYCWRLEDTGTTSDRPHKSLIYTEEELETAFHMNGTQDVNLRTLEIAFDRTCQFACSYCNPAFSSTWAKDIKNDGQYRDLVTDGRGHYSHSHEGSQRYGFNEVNPYAEAFFAWWEQGLHADLRELRLTGGEPLMSGYTWKLLDWFNENKPSCALAINTNLGIDYKKMQEFLDKTSDIPNLEIYTSNESIRGQAEYVRDGLNYQQWMDNVNTLLDSPQVKAVHVMGTINALCLPGLVPFLSSLLAIRSRTSKDLNFTLNILRFPSFQSPLVLPEEIRLKYAKDLENFLSIVDGFLSDMEREHIVRLIHYLANATSPHEGASPIPELEKDFKRFYKQYDQRRGKDFAKVFPELKDWYNDIQLL